MGHSIKLPPKSDNRKKNIFNQNLSVTMLTPGRTAICCEKYINCLVKFCWKCNVWSQSNCLWIMKLVWLCAFWRQLYGMTHMKREALHTVTQSNFRLNL